MKGFFDSKILIALMFFLLGFFSFWGGQTLLHYYQARSQPQVPVLPEIDFSHPGHPGFEADEGGLDPFEEMQRLQKQMMQGMQGMQGSATGGAGRVETREDDKFVYYDIAIPGVDPNNLQVTIENGQVSVSGKAEQKPEEEGSGGVYFSSQFHRTFPVPPGTDSDKVQVESEKEKITLKFPKLGN